MIGKVGRPLPHLAQTSEYIENKRRWVAERTDILPNKINSPSKGWKDFRSISCRLWSRCRLLLCRILVRSGRYLQTKVESILKGYWNILKITAKLSTIYRHTWKIFSSLTSIITKGGKKHQAYTLSL